MIWNHEMETMEPSKRLLLQVERLRTVLERVYQRVPFYRDAFDRMGVKSSDVHHIEDITKFPFTVKTDLRSHYPFGLFAEPRENVVRVHASSGTKGKPTVVGYTKADIDIWAEVCGRSLGCAGGQPGDTFHNAYGYGLFTGGLGIHYGCERMGMTTVPVSSGNTARQIALLNDFQSKGIACTPSYALNLAEQMRKVGISRDQLALRYGIFGAEPWTDQMRIQIEEALGVDAVDIYGLSEVMGPGVATECAEAKNGLHINEDHFYPEIIDPATGQPLPDGIVGELVFTTLTKEAMPLIRYRTGDLCSLERGNCSCGRTLVRMSRVKARVDDMLIIRGVNVFPMEIEALLLEDLDIAPHYQLIVRRENHLDVLELHVEMNGDRSEQADLIRNRLTQRLKELLQVTPIVTLMMPESLPRSEGKAVRVIDHRDESIS